MDFTKYFAGGAILSAVVGFWDKIKAVLWRIVSLFIQQVEIPTAGMQAALTTYLINNYKFSRVYDKVYGAVNESRRDGRYGLTPYELYGQRSIIFWNGKWPFWFSNNQNNDGKNQDSHHDHVYEHNSSTTTITFLRGTLNVDFIITAACKAKNDATWRISQDGIEESRFTIYYVPEKRETQDEYTPTSDGLPWYEQAKYRLVGIDSNALGRASVSTGKALDNLIFPKRIKDLIGEIERWNKSKEWYQSKNIPWKRGWLLYGLPGTGKTALARAFAEDMHLPIYVFSLAQLDNAGLMKAWAKMQVNTPCIALIEDMDNVFHGRENVSRRSVGFMPFVQSSNTEEGEENNTQNGPLAPLTFDCLLNCLDGIEKAGGIFTIITANDLSKIDSALGIPGKAADGASEVISTRPGRIDKAIELGYMEPEDMRIMASRILDGYDSEFAAMIEYIERQDFKKETPAQFQERCGQIALESYWREQELERAAILTPTQGDTRINQLSAMNN
ncbi:AAA family ATPase [Hymenobacter rubripertinctus]|uniref:ATP-binding protein n=1 Tax=Hymenobacter rubripertinctus TaxID=2029981 RepID=A0A418R2C8_9BACT|nr:AAA family ATPase [Hymenobacter rubripertinctus]RIY11573.1 ATP-binding protein [Hymenobacter rubripertinctus]